MNFITGAKFKALEGQNIFYHKIDDIDTFCIPNFEFKLITHGGDLPINENHLTILDNPLLIKWYGTNTKIIHPKLHAIPIGISYGIAHEDIYRDASKILSNKTHLVYANFKVHPWVEDRRRCYDAVKRNDITMSEPKPTAQYLADLKQSMFCLCPIGNGIDTFRVWEALYMRCIPVMVKNINYETLNVESYCKEAYEGLPIIWIDSWDSFNERKLTRKLYDETFFTSEKINFEYWKNIIND